MYHVKSTHPAASSGTQQPAIPAVLLKKKEDVGRHYPEDEQRGCQRDDANKDGG